MLLESERWRSIELEEGGFRSGRLYLGKNGLEVVVCESGVRPSREQVFRCWRARHAGRPAAVVLVVVHGGRGGVCGPMGLRPPVYERVELDQLDRICRVALGACSLHEAVRFLDAVLPQVESPLVGLVNRGLVSDHVLLHDEPGKSYRAEVWERARPLLSLRGEALWRGLGFSLRRYDRVTVFLEVGDRPVAVGVLLQPDERPDQNLGRFNGLSPVSYAIHVAERHNIRFVVMQQGGMLRIYPASIDVGVGRRGRTETYVELHLDLLRDEQAGYLWQIFSAEALVPGGRLDKLLQDSERFAGDLAVNFRKRIYNEVVPLLAQGVARARHGDQRPSQQELGETYELALTILFRLLFIAYAEDKDLLPYQANDSYRKRSLKGLALELARKVAGAGGLGQVERLVWNEQSDALWEQVRRLFVAVEQGYQDWGVPVYDGRLFSSEEAVSPIGAAIKRLRLSDRIMGPVLCHLLLTGEARGVGPVDFRSLSVREFGTIYEGLLESQLAYAEQDLWVDQQGRYQPLTDKLRSKGKSPEVCRGEFYLHNRSGVRKSTGSYYTKAFVVEHLLDEALEPALQEHLERLEGLDEEGAAGAFFDFRVADIAMGSGHFLVAAIDRLERALGGYLARRSLKPIREEIQRLRSAAANELRNVHLDHLASSIEDQQLLRRLIARRCIYGVDLNPLAVDLARLSVWVHTFVPGLPLSFLEHHLVVGNSLTGIGVWGELAELLGEQPLLIRPEEILGEARPALERLGRLVDGTPQDLAKARLVYQEALERTRPAQALCDLAAAARLQPELLPKLQELLHRWPETKTQLYGSSLHQQALEILSLLKPLHFPVAFPEVFLRRRGGFDVILGNPPWEKARVEEHAFWARHEPGLRGLSQREQERLKEHLRKTRPDLVAQYQQELAEAEAVRRALVAGPYPGMGVGDPDLYKAFCWRFWH
ncbi:MAG: hypothetical protein NZ602_00620, partial [Thermoguttaceae bacterium]|nr:hypothetical protein [Thermoguttaceae bacterium]MDW8038809.1 hypothetical protein [Thermoguttaceae bacterium]